MNFNITRKAQCITICPPLHPGPSHWGTSALGRAYPAKGTVRTWYTPGGQGKHKITIKSISTGRRGNSGKVAGVTRKRGKTPGLSLGSYNNYLTAKKTFLLSRGRIQTEFFVLRNLHNVGCSSSTSSI